MINILYLHGNAELYGADVILLEILKGLDRSKYNPYVILPNNGPLVDEIKKLNIEVEIFDYPILRRQYFTPLGIIKYMKGYIATAKYLKAYCLERNINIVHSNTIAVLEGIILKKKLNIKHIWHLHEMLDKPKLIYDVLSVLIARYSDHIVTVSESVKKHWLKSGKFKEEQFKIIYNGIDNDRFNESNETGYLREEFSVKDNDIIVGMAARVNAIKGQEVFIDAMEQVMEKRKAVKAMLIGGAFAGQEWRLKALEDRINSGKHRENFILRDFRQDVQNLHCLFDIFALPSIANDSFPTAVLEAMASGKPVVAFRNGGVVEMIQEGENGLFAEYGDAKSLAEIILKLVEDKELREKMGKNNSIRQRQYFSKENFVQSFNKFYSEINV